MWYPRRPRLCAEVCQFYNSPISCMVHNKAYFQTLLLCLNKLCILVSWFTWLCRCMFFHHIPVLITALFLIRTEQSQRGGCLTTLAWLPLMISCAYPSSYPINPAPNSNLCYCNVNSVKNLQYVTWTIFILWKKYLYVLWCTIKL
jgi:hypothetical protein